MAAGLKADRMGERWPLHAGATAQMCLPLHSESSPRPTWGDQGTEQHVCHLSFHSVWYAGSVYVPSSGSSWDVSEV